MRQRELGLQQLAGTQDMHIDGAPAPAPPARGTPHPHLLTQQCLCFSLDGLQHDQCCTQLAIHNDRCSRTSTSTGPCRMLLFVTCWGAPFRPVLGRSPLSCVVKLPSSYIGMLHFVTCGELPFVTYCSAPSVQEKIPTITATDSMIVACSVWCSNACTLLLLNLLPALEEKDSTCPAQLVLRCLASSSCITDCITDCSMKHLSFGCVACSVMKVQLLP